MTVEISRHSGLEQSCAAPVGAVLPTDISSVGSAAAAVRSALSAAGVERSMFEGMLIQAGYPEMPIALDLVFSASAVPRPSGADMAALVQAVEALLDLDQPISADLRSRTQRTLTVGRDVLAGVLFSVCAWLVLGGIVSGQNAMAEHTSALFTLAVLTGSLACLALLEAAHIGAVALSTADVSELRDSHPRVFKLHPFIATKELLENYLAGRQAGVVLVVFAVAEVTRTAGMRYLPGTALPLPTSVEWALQIGVPGALMVLVIGQVAPQLITARRPAAMMNTAPMFIAFNMTRAIAKFGLANPANWLVGWSKEHERIPSAPRERHVATTVDVMGHGTDTIRRDTKVGPTGSVSQTVTSTSFYKSGLRTHTVDLASTHQPPASTSATAVLHRDGTDLALAVVNSYMAVSARGDYHFIDTLAPNIGAYEQNDTLQTTFEASFPARMTQDRLIVSGPTRLVVLRVILECPTTPLPPATLTVANDTNVDAPEVTSVSPRIIDTDSTVEFLAMIRYPAPGSVITLRWGAAA